MLINTNQIVSIAKGKYKDSDNKETEAIIITTTNISTYLATTG